MLSAAGHSAYLKASESGQTVQSSCSLAEIGFTKKEEESCGELWKQVQLKHGGKRQLSVNSGASRPNFSSFHMETI